MILGYRQGSCCGWEMGAEGLLRSVAEATQLSSPSLQDKVYSLHGSKIMKFAWFGDLVPTELQG